MTWWQSAVLGLVQGLSEFLPVSSSGHLVLVQNMMGLTGEMLLLDTLLHLGTLAAVVAALWPDVAKLLRRPFQRTTLLLVIATIPAVAVTLLIGDAVDRIFGGAYLGYGFLLTAAVLLVAGRSRAGVEGTPFERLNAWHALSMGAAQGVAVLPGVSRSGLTICGGLLSGAGRDAAARFSFLMSVPAILGSVVYQIKDVAELGVTASAGGLGWGVILPGVLTAAVSGFFALKWMIGLVRRGRLWVFGIYTAVMGALVLCDRYWLHIVFR